MASKSFHAERHRAQGGAIDVPLAALAGLAVAFALFAMPVDLVSRLLELSRLPDLVPAAAPPIGTKARAAVSVLGAVAAFGAVLLLLRSLGGSRAEPPLRRAEQDEDAPRQRRWDAHPDAPPRRPILAGRDFGEPAPRTEAEDSAPSARPDDPPPLSSGEAEPCPEDETIWSAGEEELQLGGPGTEILDEAPPYRVEPEPEPEAEPAAAPQPRPCFEEHSIPDLMVRLERALSRRQVEQSTAAPEPPSGPGFPSRGDDRLGAAIENLQRMASRAG